MKRLYLFLFFVQLGYSQDDSLSFNPDSLETANVSTDTLSQVSAESISEESPAVLDPSIPLTIDAGYKGFLWGSSFRTAIITNFTKINKPDTSSMVKSFVGNLGPDSAHVHYFFADSGFWKVEIDIVIQDLSVEKQVQTFLRHEKNISEEDSSKLALRIARICASTDGFHKKENAKFLKWSKFLLNKNKKDE